MLIGVNHLTGWLYTLNDAGRYDRGPLLRVLYFGILLLYALLPMPILFWWRH